MKDYSDTVYQWPTSLLVTLLQVIAENLHTRLDSVEPLCQRGIQRSASGITRAASSPGTCQACPCALLSSSRLQQPGSSEGITEWLYGSTCKQKPWVR